MFQFLRSGLLLSLALLLTGSLAHAESPTLSPAQKGRIASAYGKLPLSFERNTGQTDKQVKFLSRGPGYSLFLTPTQAVMSLHKGKDKTASVLRMTLKGANPTPKVAGQDKLPGQINYLIGNDKSKWHTHIATYGQVAYKNVYKGVDLRYYGNARQLEYDFIVRPGADANAIKLGFDGTKFIALTKAGGLTLASNGGTVQWHAPVCYQTVNGKKVSVAGRFVVANNAARFAVGAYDHSKPLVIDPALEYSTYLGSNNVSSALGIAVDSTGSAYVTGQTYSTGFPAFATLNAGSNYNVFVTKLDKTGTSLVYSTLIGGNGNSAGNGVTVDSDGYANVVGNTYATDFPVTDGSTYAGGGDAFIAQLNPDGGSLYYSKYVNVPTGMSTASGFDSATAVAIDGSNYIYVAVYTYFSSSYPGLTYAAKYDDNGTFQSDNYIYGNSGGTTQPMGIAYGADGDVYVTGGTTDATLYNRNNSYHGGGSDAFVAKLTSSLSYVYATYLGGSGSDGGHGVAADASGNAYVAGSTGSSDFPVTDSTSGNAFVTKLNASGTSPLYSTRFDYDDAAAIAVDSSNRAYVAGVTNYYFNDDDDITQYSYCDVLQLAADGSLLDTQTVLENNDNFGNFINGIALDSSGNPYICGYGNSIDTTPGAYSVSGFGYTAFVAKLDAVYPVPSITGISPAAAFAGGPAFTLVVTGQGFVPGVSQVHFGSTTLSTTFVSPSELDAFVPASAISTGGNRSVTVVNPSPGGGTSNAATFAVNASLSVAISPNAVYPGAPSFGKVTLSSPVSSNTTIFLSSSDSSTASVPSSVTIATGKSSATFPISTVSTLVSDTPVTISASGAGASASAVITVLAKYTASGKVTLSGGTPLSGVVVTAGATSTFTYTGFTSSSITIAHNATTKVPLYITTKGTIIDLRVGVNISHPNAGQLAVTLISPSGIRVLLHAAGGSGANLLTDYPVLDTPAESLSVLNGTQEKGSWNLEIVNSGASTGSASLFELNFTYQGLLSHNATTDSSGNYAIADLKNATYTVTPVLAGYSFSPSSRTATLGPNKGGLNFTAGANPTLTSASPNAAYAGDGNKTLTLTGTNFASGAVAYFNGTALSTTYVSSTQLTVVVPSSLLTATGTASITVQNPAPGGTSGAIAFTIRPRLQTLSLSPSSVYSGTTVTGTVTLTGAAPIGGAVITLASSNTSAATVPSTVTVAGGATSATFAITTKKVTSSTTVTISANGAGATKTATLTVKPIQLSSLSLSSSVVAGGTSVTATVTLNSNAPSGGIVVTPSTSNSAAASVPSSVTVAAGHNSATFTVTTHSVTSNTNVTIGAAAGGVTKTKTLTLTVAAATALQSLSFAPTSVVGGSANSTGTVTLTGPAPSGGSIVTLSSNSSAISFPASTVTIPAGATSNTFRAYSHHVSNATTVTVTATLNGVSKTATITVTPTATTPVLQSLSFSPTTVVGGSANTTGTVTLSAPATADTVVSLGSSSSAISFPASTVTIAAGATSNTFRAYSHHVSNATTVTVTASLSGVSKTATITVTP